MPDEIDKLLGRDDIISALEEIRDDDPDSFLIIWRKGNRLFWRSNMTNAELVFECETMKLVVLRPEED
jgi:hypothetical protein